MQEIWKPIVGYEGRYEISSLGNVKSNSYIGHGFSKILKTGNQKGYKQVSLTKNGENKTITIHRLVAIAFVPNTYDKPCVNHINGIKDDNRVENLEWVTKSENSIHSYRVLKNKSYFHRLNPKFTLGKFGKDNPNAKSVFQYAKDGTFIKQWGSFSEAHRELGINQGNISSCCIGKYKSAGGFIWKYA